MRRVRAPLGGTLPNDQPLEDVVAQLHAFKTRLKSFDRKPTFQPTDLTLIDLAKTALVRLEREGRQTRDLLEKESMKYFSISARQWGFDLSWKRDYEILVRRVREARLDKVGQSRNHLKGLQGEINRERHRQQEMATEKKRMMVERKEVQKKYRSLLNKFGEMSLKRLEHAKEVGRLVSAIKTIHLAIEFNEETIECQFSSLLQEKLEVRKQTLSYIEAYNSTSTKLRCLKNNSKCKQHVINIINGKLSSGKFKLITFEKYLNEKLLSLKLLTEKECELGKLLETAETNIRNESLIAMKLDREHEKAREDYERKRRDIPTFSLPESALRSAQDQWLQLVAMKPTLLQKETFLLRSLKEDKREIMELEKELRNLNGEMTILAEQIGDVNYLSKQDQEFLHEFSLKNRLDLDSMMREMQSLQSKGKTTQMLLLEDNEMVKRQYQLALENKCRDKEEELIKIIEIYSNRRAAEQNVSLQLEELVKDLAELNKTLSECRTTYEEMVMTSRLKLRALVEAITKWQPVVGILIKEKFAIFSEIVRTKKELKRRTAEYEKLTLIYSKTKTSEKTLEHKVGALLCRKDSCHLAITTMRESTMKKANLMVIRQLQVAGEEIREQEQAILVISDEIKSLKEENETVNNKSHNVEDEIAELRQFHRANTALLAKAREELLQQRQRLADSWDCMLDMAEAELKLQQRTVNRLGDVSQEALIRENALQPFIHDFQMAVETMTDFMSVMVIMIRRYNGLYEENHKQLSSDHSENEVDEKKTESRTSEFSEDLVDITGAVFVEEMLQDGESTLPLEILTAKQTSGKGEKAKFALPSLVSSESPGCIELGKILQYLKRNITFDKRKLEQTQAQKTFMSPHYGCFLSPRPVSAPLVRVRKMPNRPRTKKHVYSCERLQAYTKEQKLPAVIRSVNISPTFCRKPLHLPPLPNITVKRNIKRQMAREYSSGIRAKQSWEIQIKHKSSFEKKSDLLDTVKEDDADVDI